MNEIIEENLEVILTECAAVQEKSAVDAEACKCGMLVCFVCEKVVTSIIQRLMAPNRLLLFLPVGPGPLMCCTESEDSQ